MKGSICRAAAAAAAVVFTSSVFADPPAAVPDLIWYRFDEPAGSTTTQNFAQPGVGFANAPVNGHQLGGGVLTSIGGSSTSNFVDSGWDGATGANSFSVYFEVTNPTVGNATLEYFFGNSSVGQRAFDDGVAGDTGIAFRFGGGAFATAFGAAAPGTTHEVAFVFDTNTDTGVAYVDGLPVDTIAGLSTVNVTPGQFKVGGYSSLTAMQSGTQINDFRVYGRALDPGELIPEPSSLAAMIAPALLALRMRGRTRG
jgi:hypothetical protein